MDSPSHATVVGVRTRAKTTAHKSQQQQQQHKNNLKKSKRKKTQLLKHVILTQKLMLIAY
jgi:serine acetyltransferase